MKHYSLAEKLLALVTPLRWDVEQGGLKVSEDVVNSTKGFWITLNGLMISLPCYIAGDWILGADIPQQAIALYFGVLFQAIAYLTLSAAVYTTYRSVRADFS